MKIEVESDRKSEPADFWLAKEGSQFTWRNGPPFSAIKIEVESDHKSEPADFWQAKEGLLEEMSLFFLQWKLR